MIADNNTQVDRRKRILYFDKGVLDKVLDNALNCSIKTNLNLNMVNPEYEAKLKEIKQAEFILNIYLKSFCQTHYSVKF